MVTVVENIDPKIKPVPAVIKELEQKYAGKFVVQHTVDEIPTVWVARADLLDVLLFLRKLPQPYVMLFDLSAIDERLRQHRAGLPDRRGIRGWRHSADDGPAPQLTSGQIRRGIWRAIKHPKLSLRPTRHKQGSIPVAVSYGSN